MKKLNVFLEYSADRKRPVGTLAQVGRKIHFEYSADFLADPLWLSPYKLSCEQRFHEHSDLEFGPMFGLFEDSLPDGWGLLLMDRFSRKQGLDPQKLSVLDRLAFIGRSGMGALTYEPAMEFDDLETQLIDIHEMAAHAHDILVGNTREVLPQLMRTGGSPGGARPKILAGIKGNQIIAGETDLPKGFEHWIIKFPSPKDLTDAGPMEFAYSLMARAAGIPMTDTRLFSSSKGDRFFGIKRFDRDFNRRFHIHTFGNLIHSNFRIPSCDYADLFKIIRNLTRNHQDVLTGFRQMVFNILANNRDDHVKNFTFMLDNENQWRLAPAYDLTFSHGPGGQHSMTVMGEGLSPGKKQILAIGDQAGLSKTDMTGCMDQVIHGVQEWKTFAENTGIPAQRKETVWKSINQHLQRI